MDSTNVKQLVFLAGKQPDDKILVRPSDKEHTTLSIWTMMVVKRESVFVTMNNILKRL